MEDEFVRTTYRVKKEQAEIVRAEADANFDGNVSMALRRIITEWRQFKGAQLDLSGVQEALK